MKFTVEKVLEFHDLFPEESGLDVRTLLKKYSREHLVRCCNILSNNYGNVAFIADTKNPFFSYVSKKHIPDLNNRISKYLNELGRDNICYLTTRTVLELMRIVFSIPFEEYENNGQKEDLEYDLFRSVLIINEQLMSFSNLDQLDLATLLFSNYYVQNDIIRQDPYETFARQVIYYKKTRRILD